MATDLTTANTILQQLGGKRFIVFTGSSNFVGDENSLTMRLKRNKVNAKWLKITLTPMDVYLMEFIKEKKTDGIHEGIEIVATREKAIAALKEQGYEIVNTLFTDEWYSHKSMDERGVVQIPLCFLAKSLENMSLCHAAYFCHGWEKARGCRIEHEVACAYGLDVIYEDGYNVLNKQK